MAAKVTVVGSMNLDLVVSVPHLPSPGETVLGSDVVYRPGGKGANQAVAARRLGAEVSLFAASGDDHFATDLRTQLAAQGIELTNIVTAADAPTGLALIVIRPDGESTITVAQGANRLLDAVGLEHLETELTDSNVLLLQLEIPPATALAAARLARDTEALTVLNAAPLLPSSQQDDDIKQLLSTIDVLVVNESEAGQLADDEFDRLPSWAERAARLLDLGPSLVVVTLGNRGAVAASAQQRATLEAFQVTSVDGTGAGDAFCGALSVGLAEGRDLDDLLRRACAAGALATTQVGAQSAFATEAELTGFLAAADDRRRHSDAS